MHKPGVDDAAIDLAHSLAQVENERKEPCIHCGEIWYAIHHKDGVCHSCQKLGLPGRSAIVRRRRTIQHILWIVGAIFAALLLFLSRS